MDTPHFPSLPIGLFNRLYTAFRQNPCTIEILDPSPHDGKQWVRIRNDSPWPTQLFGVDFVWGQAGKKTLSLPMVWLLSHHTDKPLSPGQSFEHPVDAHEQHDEVKWCEVAVHHNRSKHPAKKRFRVRR